MKTKAEKAKKGLQFHLVRCGVRIVLAIAVAGGFSFRAAAAEPGVDFARADERATLGVSGTAVDEAALAKVRGRGAESQRLNPTDSVAVILWDERTRGKYKDDSQLGNMVTLTLQKN